MTPERPDRRIAGFWILSRAADRPKLRWLLPVVQVIWTNCHALFVLGLVIGGCWAIDRTVRQLCGGRFGLEPVATNIPSPIEMRTSNPAVNGISISTLF